ncbi:Protein of unknown function (DUF1262 [Striga hermonthica]|uniref:DUF1262 family protein n=1 Tax=Striga hermonthica TaxID=68872 RepID=A0A9N7NB40_STRHE|nr:Protein of unknown function (DUF1262 [Striga hermonthica]
MDSFCCEMWRSDKIKRLPFPSDKILQVVHSSLHEQATVTNVWFVPVLDRPLSVNRYYIVKARGRHKGQAYTCSREGDVGMCCFNSQQTEPKIRQFDHRDRYQQFEIRPYPGGGFFARSIEWDGYPPSFLRRDGWEVHIAPSSKLHLRECRGLISNSILMEYRPELSSPLHSKRSTPVVLGRWYCPFVFVKEEKLTTREQMKESMVYELWLERWWEEVHYVRNEDTNSRRTNVVVVDARVKRLTCSVYGMDGEREGRRDAYGFVWFKGRECCTKRVLPVGLSGALFEKMSWVKETRGWFDGERVVRVCGDREVGGDAVGWRKFGCYVLVESFVLRRMDGSLVISFGFRNVDKIECKWE